MNRVNSSEVNCVPLSETSCSGNPYQEKREHIALQGSAGHGNNFRLLRVCVNYGEEGSTKERTSKIYMETFPWGIRPNPRT